jgi:DNA modification methylase
LADNRLALDAGWDDESLAVNFDMLKEMGFELAYTGFDAAEIDELFSKIHDVQVVDDEFDLENALKEASFAKRGDIWTVGRHRIMCGDATQKEDAALLMDGKKANLCVTDPPYGISYTAPTTGLTLMNDDLKGDDFYKFLLTSFQNISDSLIPGGSIYVFHADTEGLNFRRAFTDAKYHLSGVCIWVKNAGTFGRSIYQWAHEPVLYGFRKGAGHKWYSDRSQTTVWNYNKPPKNEVHGTMKPLDLIAYPIKNSSPVNGIVVDFFLGSGSTLIACEQTDRICYGMDLDDKFVSVALRRYVEFSGSDKDVFVLRDGEKIEYGKLVKEVKKK